MQRINGIDKWHPLGQPLFLALGNFDGVHLGHQSILRKAVLRAAESGGKSAVLIFDPHPAHLLKPDCRLPLLTDLGKKESLMASLGIDYFIVEPFNLKLAALAPELFVKNILLGKLMASCVVIGEDYSFGYKGLGNAGMMLSLASENGFKVIVCPLLSLKGETISSSLIRRLIISGNVKEAASYLNYYFYRCGSVVKGLGIGGKITFPTANLQISCRLLWPGRGVYLTVVTGLNGGAYFGATNVGARPTFHQETASVAETHILGFNKIIYGHKISLYFLEKLRETIAFPDPEALKLQIMQDVKKAGRLVNRSYKKFNSSLLEPFGVRSTDAGAIRKL